VTDRRREGGNFVLFSRFARRVGVQQGQAAVTPVGTIDCAVVGGGADVAAASIDPAAADNLFDAVVAADGNNRLRGCRHCRKR